MKKGNGVNVKKTKRPRTEHLEVAVLSATQFGTFATIISYYIHNQYNSSSSKCTFNLIEHLSKIASMSSVMVLFIVA